MKFMSFRHEDRSSPRVGVETSDGILDLTSATESGAARLPLGATLTDFIAAAGSLPALESTVRALSGKVIAAHTVSPDSISYCPPVPGPEKVIGIGLNYHDHAEEVGMKKPSEPLLFAMWANAVVGPGDSILIPKMSDKIDYEAELAVVIGRHARYVSVEDATSCIAGYTIVNDVSARDLQMKDNQWVRGKSFDSALPMGPVVVTTSDLGSGDNLDLRLRLNGKTMQSSNTNNLIFKVPELVSYISGAMTLKPGDIIATGTPGGVGFTRKPPVYLKSGDVVEIEIEGVGVLRNPVANE